MVLCNMFLQLTTREKPLGAVDASIRAFFRMLLPNVSDIILLPSEGLEADVAQECVFRRFMALDVHVKVYLSVAFCLAVGTTVKGLVIMGREMDLQGFGMRK